MKKILHLILVFGLLTTTFVLTPNRVEASSCSAGQYEVLTAQRDAGFSALSCHNTLGEAETAMQALPNDIDNTPVIMYDDKIVKMAGGIIDVSDASIASAINMYSTSTASSATHSFNGVFGGEMGYIDSYVVNGSLTRVKGMISGLEGWINNVSYVELIPTAHLNIGNYYYSSHDVENDTKDLYHARTYNNVITAVLIGPAPAWMVEGTNYYSFDGINFYTSYVTMSTDLINGDTANKNFTNYNYFQYLTSRTKTNYSAAELNSYLEAKGYNGTPGDLKESVLYKSGAYFIKAQEDSGVNALMEYSWALHESAYGTSTIAKTKNNIFGIGAVDSAPLTNANPFTSVEECISYHARTWVSVGYSDPITDSRYFGTSLGNKVSGYNVKYATDPYWGEGIAGQMYRIDKYLGFKDLNYYSIGILNNEIKDVIYDTTVNAYQTKNGSKDFAIMNYPVTITAENASTYQIMMDAPMRESEEQDCTFVQYNSTDGEYKVYDLSDSYPVGTLGPICEYDFKYQAEITKSNIHITNNTNFNNPYLLDTHIINVYENVFTDNVLSLKARVVVSGIEMDEDFKHYRRLVLSGINNEYSYPLTDIDTYAEVINTVDYTYAGFETSTNPGEEIDFTAIEDDVYTVSVVTYDSLGHTLSNVRLSDSDFIIINDQGSYWLDQVTVSKNYKGDLVLTKSTLSAVADFSLSDYSYNENNINIAGELTFTGLEMNTIDSHYKKLIVKNSDDEVVRDITLTNVDLGANEINGKDYSYRGFSTTITGIDALNDGEYTFEVEVYNSSDELVYTEPVNKDDYSGTISDHTYANISYTIADKLRLSLNKVDLDLREVFHYLSESTLDGNNLSFKGYAFMTYVDNDPASLSHKIVFDDGTNEYEYPMTSVAGDYDLTNAYRHDVDYSMSWFEGIVDISTLPPGDYRVYIDVSTDTYRGRDELRNSYIVEQPIISDVGTNSMEYYMNKEKFYRVELTIAEHNVMFDIAKLYAGEVFSYINGISYTGTVIDVTGYQFLPNVEHDTYDIKMVFVNESGQIFELPKIEWEGVYDITSAYNDGVNYGNPWYRFTYDTAVLAPGKYILKTVLYVNDFQISSEVLNSYNQDFSEVVSSADNNISISTNQDVRFRLELNVVPK